MHLNKRENHACSVPGISVWKPQFPGRRQLATDVASRHEKKARSRVGLSSAKLCSQMSQVTIQREPRRLRRLHTGGREPEKEHARYTVSLLRGSRKTRTRSILDWSRKNARNCEARLRQTRAQARRHLTIHHPVVHDAYPVGIAQRVSGGEGKGDQEEASRFVFFSPSPRSTPVEISRDPARQRASRLEDRSSQLEQVAWIPRCWRFCSQKHIKKTQSPILQNGNGHEGTGHR